MPLTLLPVRRMRFKERKIRGGRLKKVRLNYMIYTTDVAR